ncbi:DEAD/DEAH box helicase family protein [Prevotella sp. MA2016]|uniref:DEAD/DEAH box helicase family protein n=1 Tax=Prevotella sp. MA2016 TaxID=1408310 RepID=UPI00048EE331|nr:hypothetical protein [Prevotella sp. MA2016]
MENIINGGNARYLSELPDFKDGLPHGIVNKTKTDVGGTYVAANCRSNYIIVCPFRDLVDSIAADKNNKYDVFKCYGGVKEYQFRKYIKEHNIYKIAVTYDSLDKLLKWMGNNIDGWKVLIDEYHLILEDMDYRESAIVRMCCSIQKFKHYTFLSATPIDEDYEIDFLKKLPHYKVVWPQGIPIIVRKIKATCLPHGLARLIRIFKEEGIYLPDICGERKKVEQLFIFLNSVTTIKQVIDTLELEEDEVKVCCAQRQRNRLILGRFKRESAITPNKRINFFTKKSFQGCNLFSNNGLIIVASDVHRTQTLVDISTTMEQISGRLRENDEYHNIFRNTMVHIFSTNNSVLSQAEFKAEMNRKEDAAVRLLSLQKKADENELKALIKRVNIENDILSIEEGRLVRNELKKKAFIRKQKIREAYKDGINLRAAYNKSEKFVQAKQEYWDEFDLLLARAITISYEQLLRDYLEHPSEQYEIEYPEFKDFKCYLKETEMNSCRWNKEKMMQKVEDKKKLQQAFRAIYQRGAFISNKEMRRLLTEQFNRLGIKLSPKSTQILNCDIYHVEKHCHYINKKRVDGYELGDMLFNF